MEADNLYLDHVGRQSFYGFLSSMRGRLFQDEQFAKLYCPNNGQDSVPPSLLATALLLQAHDKVSDDLLYEMVGGNGLEPLASAMSTQCSNQLS